MRYSCIERPRTTKQHEPAGAWADSIVLLQEAIDDLIEREGIQFTALHRLLGAGRGDVDQFGNPQVRGQRRLPPSLRSRSFAEGAAFDHPWRA